MSGDVSASLRAAREELAAARLLLDAGLARSSVSRAYYAVFYAASAAVSASGETPGTHAGVINRFGFHYVRTGRIETEAAAILGIAFQRRHDADYDLQDPPGLEVAEGLLAEVEEFIEKVEQILAA